MLSRGKNRLKIGQVLLFILTNGWISSKNSKLKEIQKEIKQKSLLFVESVEFLAADLSRTILVHPFDQLRSSIFKEFFIMIKLLFFVLFLFLLLVAMFYKLDHFFKLKQIIAIVVEAGKCSIDDSFDFLFITSLYLPWWYVSGFFGFPGLFLTEFFGCTRSHRYFNF